MKYKNDIGERFAKFVLNNRIKCLILCVLVLSAFLPGLSKIYFNSQYRYFFGPNNPQLQEFDKLQNVYSKEDNIIIAIVPESENVFTKETLKAIEVLTERSWKTPYSTRVDSITNFQHTEANEDDLVVRRLVEDPDSLTPEEITKVKMVALSEPILLNRLVTEKSDITAVTIQVNIPGLEPMEVPETAAFVREMTETWKQEFPGHDVYLTGVLMVNNAFVEAGMNDMQRLTPIMYLAILIFIVLLLRSFSAVIGTLVVILFSVLTGMGFAGWMQIPISPPSAIAPTVILTLAIADSVHFLTSMFSMMRRGMNKIEAIVESMKINFLPIVLTSITTMIGFLALNSSDSPPYHDLGNISAVGVAGALFYSLFMLPIIMSVLPVKVKQEAETKTTIYKKIGDFIIGSKGIIVPTIIIISLVLGVLIPRIEINDKFIQYFHPSIKFRSDTDFVQERLTGVYQIQYDIRSEGEQGITNPEYLQKLEDFSSWLRQQDEIVHVMTFSDIMKKINKSMHGDDENFYIIPDNKQLAAQYLLLYEMSLPFGLDLNNQVDINKSSTQVVVTLENLSIQEILTINKKAENWLQNNTLPYMDSIGSGPTIMFSHITERNIAAMTKGTLIALLLITIIMIISLRSIKYGLISIIPNAFPVIIAFGIWSLLVGEVGFAISVVASVTLGIIVDDTVHFLSKYVRNMREGNHDPVESVRYSFNTVGSALLTTSIILVIGFLILSFSTFKLNQTLGILSAMTVTIALLVDFLLLPSILILIDSKFLVKKPVETAEGV